MMNAIPLILVVVAVITAISISILEGRNQPKEDNPEEVYGKAKIKEKESVVEEMEEVFHTKEFEIPPKNCLILGKTYRRHIDAKRYMYENNNIFIFAMPGGGKTYTVVLPNLLQMNGSYIVVDPSGELLTATGKMFEEAGYAVKVLNTFNMKHSNRYNPLANISTDNDVKKVVDCFVRSTGNVKSSDGDFWTNAETMLVTACVYYLRDFELNPLKRNFSTIYEMIAGDVEKAKDDKEDQSQNDYGFALDRLFGALPKNSQAYLTYAGIRKSSEKTFANILITALSGLHVFLSADVRALTKYDEMELDKIATRKTIVYVCVPPVNDPVRFLAAMFFEQITGILVAQGNKLSEKTGSCKLPNIVNLIVDEFPSLGRLNEFENFLANCRKYGINTMLIAQSVPQLKAMYGDSWELLTENCAIQMLLGANGNSTAKHFSDLIGTRSYVIKNINKTGGKNKSTNISYNTVSAPLRSPAEICQSDKRYLLIIRSGDNPFYDEKYDPKMHPNYKKTGYYSDQNKYKVKEIILEEEDKKLEDELNLYIQGHLEIERLKRQNVGREARKKEFRLS